jgi:hypothetical protein
MNVKCIVHAVNVTALQLLIAYRACARCYDFRKRQQTLQVVGARDIELIVDSYHACA